MLWHLTFDNYDVHVEATDPEAAIRRHYRIERVTLLAIAETYVDEPTEGTRYYEVTEPDGWGGRMSVSLAIVS